MPFRSEKQRRYMYANEPEIAKKWSKKYGNKIKKLRGGGMDASQDDFSSPPGNTGNTGSDKGHTRFAPGSGYYGGPRTKTDSDKGSTKVNKPPASTKDRPFYKPPSIPVVGPLSFVTNKVLGLVGPMTYDYNKKKREKFAKDKGLTREFYATRGKVLDVMDPKNKGFLKDAGYGPFQDKKVDRGGDGPQPLCPDGTRPPCVTKSQGTAAPQQTKKEEDTFLKNFQAYDKGGLTKTIPPLSGPNPQVPPVKLRKGRLTQTYKMSCPHRPDGIRGVGKAIRGHKFTGVK